jgi:hypothetical protein
MTGCQARIVESTEDNSYVEESPYLYSGYALGTIFDGEEPIGQTEAIAENAAPPVTVAGWPGIVISTPPGAQFDDYVIFQPEGAGAVGLVGATPALEVEIINLRNKDEPGKYAHFWGILTCNILDYGGCQLLVTQLRYGSTTTGPEPVEGLEGTIVSNPPGSQFDDHIILAGGFAAGLGIHSYNPTTSAQLEDLRDTDRSVRVWGELRTGVADTFGSQINVRRLEAAEIP